ncbi:MAG: TIGR00282 family metallophosphoesterase [Alphaproteobacteria bacterium]|nr:TIGR00282 family metallophosphoesterase [Alphaproteobacteria bacterium]
MRILFVGDVVGRSGRDAIDKHLASLRQNLRADVVIVNGENSSHGIGISSDICKGFYASGTDCITLGNHAWDNKEILTYIDRDPRLIRPINYPKALPGKGHYLHSLNDGRKILVINAMARLFMDPLDDPFDMTMSLVKAHPLGSAVQAIFVDFHGEASSEKMAFGHYLDGYVSAIVGTHTHIPTADNHVLNGGTAFMSDAGMTGDYDSVIGMKKDVPIQRFVKKISMDRLSPSEGEATLCGCLIETDDKNGRALKIGRVRIGPRLQSEMPDF